MKSCKQTNCTKPARTRDYCQRHYQRALRTGVIQRVREMHGQSKSALYYRWSDMKKRCNNKNHAAYEHYGARGIRVCKRWNDSFLAFLADMGEQPTPQHTLDRIDNNGDYSPGNVRWATMKEQANNKSNNVTFTYADMTLTMMEWSELMNLPYATVQKRINADWPLIRVLCEPPNYYFERPDLHGWCKPDDSEPVDDL